MTTLLVLGSKPEPVLPPAGTFEELACANASGHSAARLGLPAPCFTAMSALVFSGRKPANDLALQALRGLRTGILYIYPRSSPTNGVVAQMLRQIKGFRTSSWYMLRTLRSLDYRWDEVRDPGLDSYFELFKTLCGGDPKVLAQIERKRPSTGMLCLALGLVSRRYSRVVLSGFSFEITHAYANNPLIAERGAASRHADSDIEFASCVARRHGRVFTTESIVHRRTGVPMLPELERIVVPDAASQPLVSSKAIPGAVDGSFDATKRAISGTR
jgi:hypothetical protein